MAVFPAADELTLAEQTDWRVPNLVEMASLVSLGEADVVAWLTAAGFTGVQSGRYFTSTTNADDTDQAWCVATTGTAWLSNEQKTDGCYVIAVRGPDAP